MNKLAEFRRFLLTLAVAVTVLPLAGCSWFGKDAAVEADAVVVNLDDAAEVEQSFPGYTRFDVPNGGVMLTKNTAVGVAGYDSVVPSEVGFNYAKRQKPLDNQDAKRLQEMLLGYSEYFLSNTMQQFVVSEPSECAVSLGIKLRELELYDSNVIGSQSTFVRDLGSTVVAIEIRDSMTNDLIFTYMEKVKLGGGLRSSSGVDLKRLDQAIEKTLTAMAGRYAPHVVEGPVDARAEYGCEGKIGKARQQRYAGDA